MWKNYMKMSVIEEVLVYTALKLYVFGVIWSIFSRIWTEYREILRTSPHSLRMREIMEQKNSEYGQFSRSDTCKLEAEIP